MNDFKDGAETRTGSEDDTNAMTDLLRNFDLTVKLNPTKEALIATLERKLNDLDTTTFNSFTLVVMSHGGKCGQDEYLIDVDGKDIPLNELLEVLSKHGKLKGKLVLVFCQTCRGPWVEKYDGSTVVRRTGKRISNGFVAAQTSTEALVGSIKDRHMIIWFPTSPGYGANRNLHIPKMIAMECAQENHLVKVFDKVKTHVQSSASPLAYTQRPQIIATSHTRMDTIRFRQGPYGDFDSIM